LENLTILDLGLIRTDGEIQPRSSINTTIVDEYMADVQAGMKLPPVTVFYDGTNHWLADGFHRHEAAGRTGRRKIECEVYQGTQQDAQWYSFSANKTNSVRRTNDDKQRAVKAVLQIRRR